MNEPRRDTHPPLTADCSLYHVHRGAVNPPGKPWTVISRCVAAHSRVMTPATKSNAGRNPQHPAQQPPCLSPIRKLPELPDLRSILGNPKGERQCLEHACFQEGHRKHSAARSSAPPSKERVLAIIGESKAAE